MSKFIIKGGKPLKGTVSVSGSKNAALPILCATVLTNKPVILKNIPNIADIKTLSEILEDIGAKVEMKGNTIKIDNSSISKSTISSEKACKVRASLLLAGPMLGKFKKVKLPYPGGCVIGKRPIDSHIKAFEKLGANKVNIGKNIEIKASKGLKGANIIMSEISVTGTENAIMASVLAKGTTEIRLSATEPHVEDLCNFLVKIGAKIKGIGTHTLVIQGVKELKGGTYSITPDYLEAGTLILAGIITQGKITVKNVIKNQLDAFFNKLDEIGAKYIIKGTSVTTIPTKKFKAPSRIESRIFPGFPTDLQAPFSILLTQCEGFSKIFETMFEGRLNYLFELEKMGLKVEILNPHQAIIIGPNKLRGVSVSSLDLRAGAAMVLAALIARGTTEVNNIFYIDRGYENLEEKLRSLGANIKRKE